MGKHTEDAGYQTKTDKVNSSGAGRRKKKARREAVLIVSLAVLACVAVLLCMLAFIKVGTVVVENTAVRYSNEQIIAASGVKEGDSLFSVNKKAVAQNIEKALPYIGSVTVKTKLPGTLTISVEYTRPKMCVMMDDGYALMDVKGKVLQTGVSALPDYIAVVTGATVLKAVPGETAEFLDPDLLKYVTDLAAAFEEKGITRLTALDLSDLTDVVAEIDYSVEVRFGAVTKVADKLEFGKTVIDETLRDVKNGGTRMVIDLSGDKSAYVRSRDSIDADKNNDVTLPPDDLLPTQDVPSTQETGDGNAEDGDAEDGE